MTVFDFHDFEFRTSIYPGYSRSVSARDEQGGGFLPRVMDIQLDGVIHRVVSVSNRVEHRYRVVSFIFMWGYNQNSRVKSIQTNLCYPPRYEMGTEFRDTRYAGHYG